MRWINLENIFFERTFKWNIFIIEFSKVILEQLKINKSKKIFFNMTYFGNLNIKRNTDLNFDKYESQTKGCTIYTKLKLKIRLRLNKLKITLKKLK